MQPRLLLRGQDATTCCRSGFAVTKIKSSGRISPVTHQGSAPARKDICLLCVSTIIRYLTLASGDGVVHATPFVACPFLLTMLV